VMKVDVSVSTLVKREERRVSVCRAKLDSMCSFGMKVRMNELKERGNTR